MSQPARLTIAIFNEKREWSLPSAFVERITKAAGEGVLVTSVHNRTELIEVLPETDYLVGLPPTDDQLFQLGGRLKWIQLTGSLGDLESALLPALRSAVRISTVASVRAAQIAEHAMALALALVRRLDTAMSLQADQRWAPDVLAPKLRTLRGATMGIIAQTSVGNEVAARAKPFGMHILATRRTPGAPTANVDEIMPESQLSELLARIDLLVVAAPKTPSTEYLIGRTQFGQMKRTAILIDVARSGVVQQSALVDALQRQRIAGAGLDAFESEPLAPNSPLWALPNVIITPHVASASPAYWSDVTELICRNIVLLRNQQPLIDEVDEKWYAPMSRR